MRALISVYYKDGVLDLARALQNCGYQILSTGGTAKYLQENGISVVKVEEVTKFPEILDGRVKTLHPAIHGGILFRDYVQKDIKEIESLGIEPIDVVVVNLYPFEDKIRENLSEKELIEFIDIGGPALIRASAKNFYRVTVVVDPKDYHWVSQKIKEGKLTIEDRKFLAVKAFSYTAYYDSIVSRYLADLFEVQEPLECSALALKLEKQLRYGENPHQRGYLFSNPLEPLGITRARVIQGKEMSFNNYLDADSAVKLVSEFEKPTCVIVKHNNPCAVSLGDSILDAFLKAYSSDPESAFGGIVAFNDVVDEDTATEINKIFFEIVIAPEFSQKALEILSKKKNLRVLQYFGHSLSFDIKKVSGGYLMQDEDTVLYEELRVVSQREPTDEEIKDMIFAYRVCKYVKSNAIVLAKDGRTLAIGSGNVSRVDSLRCAIARANRFGFDLRGALMASEAFLPFRDSVDIAKEAGIAGIIQPGGSIRDKEVIDAVNEHGMAMVFTNRRHFRH